MVRNFELRFFVGEIECILMDVMTDLHTGKYKYYQHCHPGFELHYISEGYFEVFSNKRKLRVCAGELLIVPPGVYHYVTAISENACRMTLSVDILYTEENNYSIRDKQFYNGFPKEQAFCAPVLNTPVQEDLERIQNLTRDFDRSYLSAEKLRALSSILLIDLFAILSKGKKIDMQADVPVRSVQEFTIDAFLGNNFMQNDSSQKLAKALNVSPRQLHRIMKKAYGMNYREKLKQIRVEIATDFLINSSKSMKQIAKILGYNSSANFSAFIKRETGKTPTMIRKEETTAAKP